ncbi:MAG: DUF4136 domain-containing protein [Ekhidna sp.]|nr:DUF4136 domain-containing protein [Ekhidna sp.]
MQVKIIQRPYTTFDSYQTWCWIEGCEVIYQGPSEYYNKKVINELSNAIAFNMFEKGYQQLDETADLLVNFTLIMEEDSVQLDRDFPIGGDFKKIDQSWVLSFYPEYYHYLSGSLIIDIIDRKTSELIWRSYAKKYVEVNAEVEKDKIWKGVAKAMKKFPKKSNQ